MARNLKECFPFASLCIYNGKSIASLQHHLLGNNMTYVETDRQAMEGVTVPTLEKLLVDINKDADFSYLHGAEAERMMDNAKALYIINTTRLRRYAKRSGLKIEENL